MIRPEAKATLWRWREVLAGLGAICLGFYWIAGPGNLLGWIGWAVALGGAAFAAAGVQRGRFRGPSDGPGVVQVVEGQISYFGPLSGGHIALSELSRLSLDRDARPPHWRLDQPGQPQLAIPVNARGAEALLDVFGQLPGVTAARLVAAQQAPAGTEIIWQSAARTKAVRRLH